MDRREEGEINWDIDADPYPFDRDADYDKWKASRFDFIGSSTIPTIIGLNKYSSRIAKWRNYVARQSDFTGNYYTEWGHFAEPKIVEFAQRQADDKGLGYTLQECNNSFISREFTFASATPDALVWSESRQCLGIGEVKYTGRDADIWKAKQIPSYVYAQMQWQMGVCKLPWSVALAMVSGNPYIIQIELNFNEKVFNAMIESAKAFMNEVKTNTPPTRGAKGYMFDKELLNEEEETIW